MNEFLTITGIGQSGDTGGTFPTVKAGYRFVVHELPGPLHSPVYLLVLLDSVSPALGLLGHLPNPTEHLPEGPPFGRGSDS